MSAKVFISHTSQDLALAEEAKVKLLEEHLLPSDSEFLSIRDIPSGENVRLGIKTEIGHSDTVVFVLSDDAEQSAWMNYEMGMADALEKPIIVVGKKGAGRSSAVAHLAKVRIVDLDV